MAPQTRDLESLVRALRAERARIVQRLERLHTEERELSAVQHDQPMDDPERAADLREVRLEERLDELAARQLEAIDRALDHAAQGRLSLCDRCGARIPVERLLAVPGTTLCVACAGREETAPEPEVPFERVPGGRAETGRIELGEKVKTRFDEGRLLRVAWFGTCRRCGDVEGRAEPGEDFVLCGACGHPLAGARERAIVAVEEREVYVDPAELVHVDPAPYD
jgi:RNA polymerase-binding transcription factor DksA